MFYNDEERKRAYDVMGKDADIEAVLTREDLAHGEILFAATGVTSGGMLDGVRFTARGCRTHSLVMRSKSGTVRTIEALHNFEQKPHYTLDGFHQKMDKVE